MHPKTTVFRMINDDEPTDKDLQLLMHEVAVEAKKKANSAKIVLAKKIHTEIVEALVREGFPAK